MCARERRKVVSSGYINEPGYHHAEAMALDNLKMDTEGISMLVILGPCSFQGKTPSCAKEIVKTKIKEIYVSLIDPHPKKRGKGIEIFQQAGINVHTRIMYEELML